MFDTINTYQKGVLLLKRDENILKGSILLLQIFNFLFTRFYIFDWTRACTWRFYLFLIISVWNLFGKVITLFQRLISYSLFWSLRSRTNFEAFTIRTSPLIMHRWEVVFKASHIWHRRLRRPNIWKELIHLRLTKYLACFSNWWTQAINVPSVISFI